MEKCKKLLESLVFDNLDTATGKVADRVVINNSKEITVGTVFNINQPSSSTDKNYSESFQIQRESLMNYYKTKKALKSLLWSEKSKDFSLKEYFVDLTVQEADLLGKKAGETIHFTQIFPKFIDEHVAMLVTADPGYGKTTFCKKLAYDWGTDTSRTGYLGHYDFTIVINLRELQQKNITDEILQRICENTDSNCRDELRNRGYNLLIILVGFDEADDQDSIIQFIEKDSFRISKKMTILLTCLPRAAEYIRENVNMRFTIQGFSQQQKEKYIKLIFNDDDGRRDELLNLIKFSDFHSALAECPLMLHMLCCLPQTKYFHKIQTKTDLFIQIFRLLIERYIKKLGQEHHLKEGKFFYGEELLVKLGEIYLDIRSEGDKIDTPTSMNNIHKLPTLTDKQLKKKFPEEKDYRFILGLDIFAKYFEVDGISCFDFVHRSFFEFIIALCYYHSKHIAPDCTDEFIILMFLCGFYGDEKFSNNFINTIRQNIHSPRIWLECVDEIKDRTNKELFCSNAKVYFNISNLQMMTDILKLPFFRLSRIYINFPCTECFYEGIAKKLIDLHHIYKNSDKLEIFLLLDESIKYLEKEESFNTETLPKNIRDIRQSVDLIQNLINGSKWNKFSICLRGVLKPKHTYYPVSPYNLYNFFNDVENPAVIPIDLELQLHETSKNLVALLSNDEFKYLISTEQYLSLKDNIKLSSEDECTVNSNLA